MTRGRKSKNELIYVDGIPSKKCNDCNKIKPLFDYYQKTEGTQKAIQNGCASMASDIGKHNETRSAALASLCVMQAMMIHTRQEFVKFINGFN